MKQSFISIFLEILSEVPNFLDAISRRESMHYMDLRMMGYDPHKIYRGFRNLEHRGLIRTEKSKRFQFTKKGTQWFRSAYLKHAKDLHPEWDGLWRLVIFDIPEELRYARNTFRRKLRSFGFFMIQKSVLAFPYPCEEDLGYICQELKISPYVDIMLVKSLGAKEEQVKKSFSLK